MISNELQSAEVQTVFTKYQRPDEVRCISAKANGERGQGPPSFLTCVAESMGSCETEGKGLNQSLCSTAVGGGNAIISHRGDFLLPDPDVLSAPI